MNASAILAFLDQFGRSVIFQEIPAGRRRKNAAVLTFIAPGSGELKVVGGSNLASAVMKAVIRSRIHQEKA